MTLDSTRTPLVSVKPLPPSPTVTALSPASGSVAGGNTVVIDGTHLAGTTVVKFGGAQVSAAGITVVSDGMILVKAPAHAAVTVPVHVTTPSGISPGTAADEYTYR